MLDLRLMENRGEQKRVIGAVQELPAPLPRPDCPAAYVSGGLKQGATKVKSFRKSALSLETAALAIALAGLGHATTASAQAAAPAPAADCVDADGNGVCDNQESSTAIVVTGSRIKTPNLVSTVPVTSITGEDLLSKGDTNIGDALNDLPQIRSTYSQANSTRFIGTAGVNFLDLRGLGISRTLVLVNGRRHITASVGDFIVDTNTIPSDLIDRVDVVTGGSSAVYGSDAVAGVINFILKRNFQGIKLNGQSGVSSRGDRGINILSLTAGQNFGDGRGNVAINLEYVNADPLYFRDRPELSGVASGRCQFNNSSISTGEPQSGNGVADQSFVCGVRNGTISNGGTVVSTTAGLGLTGTQNCTNPLLAPGQPFAAGGTARCLNPGTSVGQFRLFRFDANGNLIQDTPAYDFRPFASGNIIDDPNSTVPGSNLRDTGQYAPGLKRFTANLIAHFDVSDGFKPFIEAKYVRIRALQEGQPSFFSTISSTIGAPNLKCTNAFVTPATLATLQSIGVCGNPATGTIRLNRFNVDFGGRSERIARDTWRIVGGVQGNFNTDWNYEISATYGEVKVHQDELNDLKLTDLNGNFDGFLLAYDAVRNDAGQIVCGVNQATVTRPDCVPINLFGNGQPSAAARSFVNTTSFVDSKATEFDVLGFVNGDSSGFFNMPGGPAKFSVGFEYRRETARQDADPLSAAGGTFFNAFKPFHPPAFDVKEVFGELEVPILRDVPFFQELTVSGAARYSDYNTPADKTFAWNVGGTWAPIHDLRFRANYSRSVRVPTISDLYSPASQNFAFIADPCDILNIGNGSTNRAANCLALGVPVGFVNTPARTASTGFLSSGNSFLQEEEGRSLTVGGVFQPSFIPGLSLTVDYYNITVNNLIATLSAQTILNQCVDLPTINNQYCQLLNPRNSDSTFKNPALTSAGVNFAKQKARGIDFQLDYGHKFDGGWKMSFHAVATYVIQRDNFVSPTDPQFADQQLLELGDPQWAANFTLAVGKGPFTLKWSGNYIGKQTIGVYENYFSVQGRPPQNADLTNERFYPSVLTHDLRLDIQATNKFDFYVGMDNVFDRLPPFGLLGNEGGNPFDSIGRYVYAGFKASY